MFDIATRDEWIMALADGELEDALASRVRNAVICDGAAQRKYDVFVSTRALGSIAFREILAEPVPQRLLQAVTRPSNAPSDATSA